MDEFDRAELDEFELSRPELALAAREALEAGARLSLAARRFVSGAMGEDEARELGYIRGRL